MHPYGVDVEVIGPGAIVGDEVGIIGVGITSVFNFNGPTISDSIERFELSESLINWYFGSISFDTLSNGAQITVSGLIEYMTTHSDCATLFL